jgi:ABC-type multidrug transport system ATPase subunit
MRVAYGSSVVIDGMDLTVSNSEIVAVTGVNGAGKSTLLRCLAGSRRPAAGTLQVLGAPPRDDAASCRAGPGRCSDCWPGREPRQPCCG